MALDLANTMESQVNIWNMASFVVLFNVFLAAIIVAVFLNERLFSTRAATFYGSLPAKRDAVFVTTYLAGFLPLVAVEAIVAVVLLPLAAANPGITFGMVGAWLALAVAFTFILYSLAVLLCQITGTRAVAVFLYLLVNVLAVCIEMAIRFIVSAFVWGVCIPLAFFLSRYTGLAILPMYILVQSLELIKCVTGFFLVKSRRWVNNLVSEI